MQYELNIEQKTTLWSEGGKFCLDLAKLIFGGIILASIMKKDIDAGKLLVFGALITMFLAVCGFFLILMSKDKKRKEINMELLVFMGFLLCLLVPLLYGLTMIIVKCRLNWASCF